MFRPVVGECLRQLYCATDQTKIRPGIYRADFASDMGRPICMHLDLTGGDTVLALP